jgi:hypothetical protein
MVEEGKLAATTDPRVIRAWWGEWPEAMIGGRCDGLVVLDFDAYKPGHREDLAGLGDLPATREYSTPGQNGTRGRHLVYLDPRGEFRSTKLGKNKTIDVRAGTSRDYIVLPPSPAASGNRYEVTSWRHPAHAPGWLSGAAGRSREAAEPVLDLPDQEALPNPLPPELAKALANDGLDRSAHTQYVAYVGAEYGLTDGQILTLLESDLVTQARRAEAKRRSPRWWPAEFGRVLAYARAKCPRPDPPEPGDIRQLVDNLVMSIRRYEYLPDPSHVLATLGAAVTSGLDHDAVWLLLVGPPSSGKTSATNLLGGVSHQIDYASESGLLGWQIPPKKDQPAVPGGILAEIGNGKKSLVTIADLSTLMRQDRSNRSSDLWSAMRRIYDGHYFRDVNPPGGRQGSVPRLEWHGRLTVVGAVTGEIDQYLSNNELGPRWLYYRMPVHDDAGRREMSALVMMPGREAMKSESAEMAVRILGLAREQLEEAPAWLVGLAREVSEVTCFGRASVPRANRSRDVSGIPEIEDPGRVVSELTTLGRGLLALGQTRGRISAMLRKTALDSMPALRRRVLTILSRCDTGDPFRGPTTASVARLSGRINWRTARVVLDDLDLIGVVQGEASARSKHEMRSGAAEVTPDPEGADEADRRVMQWCLAGARGELVAKVIQDSFNDILLLLHCSYASAPCMRSPKKPPPRARVLLVPRARDARAHASPRRHAPARALVERGL